MDIEFVRERITQLRLQKGVSEYKMSYDLGHSRGYINNISSGKTLPSMSEFLAICEYMNITPMDFFNEESNDPEKIKKISKMAAKLNEDDLDLIEKLIRKLSNT